MANKRDVLRLLAQGLTPNQVAERLGCCSGYVRATRRRATEDGAKLSRKYGTDWWRRKYRTDDTFREKMKQKQRERYETDPAYRAAQIRRMKEWRARQCEATS